MPEPFHGGGAQAKARGAAAGDGARAGQSGRGHAPGSQPFARGREHRSSRRSRAEQAQDGQAFRVAYHSRRVLLQPSGSEDRGGGFAGRHLRRSDECAGGGIVGGGGRGPLQEPVSGGASVSKPQDSRPQSSADPPQAGGPSARARISV